jgi:transmembrane sensor
MEPSEKPPEVDPLLRQAIGWLVRLNSGEATTADAAEFTRWRGQSAEHESAVRRAVELWRLSKRAAAGLPEEGAGSGSSLAIGLLGHRSTRRAFLGAAIAAGAAGYFVARPPLGLWPSLAEMSSDYRTGKGEQLKVALGPGISLELGTLTSIAVDATASATKIELIDGQAAINASTAPGHELIVIAAGGQVIATRADFDTRCIDDAVSVTCAAGIVDVGFGASKVQLRAGQQIAYSGSGLGAVTNIDAAQATSWRQGVLIFKDEPLNEVIKEINRYRAGRIFITNSNLGARIVNGTFHCAQLANFVSQVKQLFGAKVIELPGGVTLLS